MFSRRVAGCAFQLGIRVAQRGQVRGPRPRVQFFQHAVVAFLKKGLPMEKIQTIAYGENNPLKNNLNKEDKKHNRRVEIHVIRKKHP